MFVDEIRQARTRRIIAAGFARAHPGLHINPIADAAPQTPGYRASMSDQDRRRAGLPSPASPASPAQLAPALLRLADTLAWPLLLMDADGVLRHANLAARQCLADRQPLCRLARQRLSPTAEPLRPAFLAALQAAAAGQLQVLTWPTPAGEIQGRLHRLPFAAGTETLLMLVLSVDGQPGPDLLAYASASHLSAPERRVLDALVRAGSADGVAADLGLALSTVRRHVNALRRKTGHASVAELLMTVGRLPPAMHTALSLSQTMLQTTLQTLAPSRGREGK